MDKSSGIKKNIVKIKQANPVSPHNVHRIRRLVIGIALALLLFILFGRVGFIIANTGGNSPNKTGRFDISAEDLNLLSLKSFLNANSPNITYEGEIDLSAQLKVEDAQTIASGEFSSDKVSFSSEKFLFPLECSQIRGEFVANIKEDLPAITGQIESDYVKWGRLLAQNLIADYVFEGENLVIKKGELKIAGGIAKVSGNIDFSKTPAFFNIKLLIDGVDISVIAGSWGYTRPISGMLFSDANLSGEIGKPAGIFGKAKINIDKGELGKVGWVGRMLTLSPLAALSRDFSLTDFKSDFTIAEGYAYTDNAELKGPGIRITATGEAGWNKKLDFILGLYSSSEMLKGTPITRLLGAILDDFGNVLRKIKLSGTIDNPSFTVLPLGIGGAIVEGLERTFEKGPQEDLR